ncbi:LADA_0H06942g1_1 [Lachancea dasiensis]|uniref:AP-1 complex subunit gamma n=1 Tax=Lachancea dasiensis TaxID=1072105 RepID=A0A1G4K240_9SACH|nr:LADA_0H06942g1_1 [Lachancea dasiensis]
MGSLRTFIKDVRGAKTLAEERSIVTKESARIRTKLKDDHLPQEKRRKNIHKLLYLHILGEKTHFAQVECINLIASDDFRDKRLGYLAAMILLDEHQEVLTLLTNLISNDLTHPNRYVVSLALSTLGSLTSPELARDLYPDVETILARSTDEFLVKKALQCAAKLIERDASLLEIFYPYVGTILKSHHLCTHGGLLGVVKLCQVALSCRPQYEYDNYPEILQSLVANIPELFSLLQDMNSTSFNPEYDVGGTCDPFLQVELLYTLRLMFELAPQGTDRYKNKLNDILTKIATNSDGSKNAAHAVLYECVRTIFALQLDQSLKILGVNVLAKFLGGKDNNTKYVGLNTLLDVVPQEPNAVQKHRKFISRCLFDPDISIRARAVELTFAILNDSNMTELVEELLSFLKGSDDQDKDLIISTVNHLVNHFDSRTPDQENWAIDVMVQVLKVVGQHISLDKVSEVLLMINNGQDLNHKLQVIQQILTVSLGRLEGVVKGDNLAWKLMSVWCIGEYGDILLQKNIFSDTRLAEYLSALNHMYSDSIMLIGYVLTAALKLSSKTNNPGCVEELRQIIMGHTRDTNLMLQNKSYQYSIIFNQPAGLKHDILGAMPFFEKKSKGGSDKVSLQKNMAPPTKPVESSLLLDLLETSPPRNPPTKFHNDVLASQVENDTRTAPLAGNGVYASVPENAAQCYTSSEMAVFMRIKSVGPEGAELELFVRAVVPMHNVQIFAAVSKTQKLILGTLSSASLESDQVCVQELRVSGSGKLKFRIKIVHQGSDMNLKTEQFDHKFDQSL